MMKTLVWLFAALLVVAPASAQQVVNAARVKIGGDPSAKAALSVVQADRFPQLIDAGAWTVGAGWTETDDNEFEHTTPSGTATLTQALTIVAGQQYRVEFVVEPIVTGSYTVTVGGTTVAVVTADGEYGFDIIATNTSGIVITPSGSPEGWVYGISVSLSSNLLRVADWTVGSGWTENDPHEFEHTTPAGTATLSQAITPVPGTQYYVEFWTGGMTAGTYTVTLGGEEIAVITEDTEFGLTFTALTDDGLVITPSGGADGEIGGFYVEVVIDVVRVDAPGVDGVFTIGDDGAVTFRNGVLVNTRDTGNALQVASAENANIFDFIDTSGATFWRAMWDASNIHQYINKGLQFNLEDSGGVTFNGMGSTKLIYLSGGAKFVIENVANDGTTQVSPYATVGTPLQSTSGGEWTTFAWNGSNGYSLASYFGVNMYQLSTTPGDARLDWRRGSDGENILAAHLLSGDFGMGINTTTPSARLHLQKTTEQLRLGYSSTQYVGATVGSTGGVVFDSTGSLPYFAFLDILSVTSATEQLRLASNPTNYLSVTTGATGVVALDAVSATAADAITIADTIGHPSYTSQATNWRVTAAGAADYRYLFADEMRIKLFSAEEQAVYRASLMVTRSHSEVSQAFTCPAAAGTATLWVRDAATLADARVFTSSNWVSIRNFTRTDADTDGAQELVVGDCVGQVTSYADGSGANAGQQSWTFTRGSGGSAGTIASSTVIPVGNAVLDFGVAGNGIVELNAFDGTEGVNAPYFQTKTWATSPVAANFVVTSRMGNLSGAYAYTSTSCSGAPCYGVAGGVESASHFTIDPHNGFRLRSGATNRLHLAADGSGSMATDAITWNTSGVMTIGGWTIAATTISATNITLTSGAANTAHLLVGTGANAGGLNSANAASDIGIFMGSTHANRATAPFRVEADGSLVASDATITSPGGAVVINSTGISVTVPTSLSLAGTYKFTPVTIAGTQFGLGGFEAGGGLDHRYLSLDNVTTVNNRTVFQQTIDNSTADPIQILATAYESGASLTSQWSLTAPRILLTGTTTLAGAMVNANAPIRFTGEISPTQLVAATNNWNPTSLSTANVIRINVDAARNLTGIVAQEDGRTILLYNTTAFTITLKHDATSTAANRFYGPGAADYLLTQKSSVWIRYDGTHERWTIIR